MKRKLCIVLIATVAMLTGLTGCQMNSNALKDGYYTAQTKDPLNGWWEFVTIFVKDGEIISVEYNAKNASGFIKSWDMSYMRKMNEYKNMYPNRYTREYGRRLLNTQDPTQVDVVAGASNSGALFVQLSSAAIELAREGKSEVAFVGKE